MFGHYESVWTLSVCTPQTPFVTEFVNNQCFLSLSRSLSTALLVAEIVCARQDETLKAKLLSTTFFMSGLCTFLQNTIVCNIAILLKRRHASDFNYTVERTRLPLYQGPAMTYVIPLLAMSTLKEWQCPDVADEGMFMDISNTTNSSTGSPVQSELEHDPLVLYKLQQFTGSLMIAGIIHMLIGMTGIVGYLVRFIGPVTVVPALTAVSLYSFRATVKFAQAQWGVAYLTAGTTIVLSLYLRKFSTPIPMWTYSKGFYIKRTPFHKVFSVLIGAILGWVISVILTEAGAFSADTASKEFYARTDSRTHVIDMTRWFTFPYPGQFGAPAFSSGAFITFLFGTITSVLDSIGDYYACAKICSLPSPPAHSMNRGIAVEGFSSFLAGSAGAGHATSTFGGNIGAIGITKVASLRVFQVLGLLYMIFGVIGKVGAVCVTIPYSVVGGMQMINFGVLCGVMISNIQYTDMKSTRNHVIIGCSLFIGLMMPYWMRSNPDALDTGTRSVIFTTAIIMTGSNRFT
ncbi:hypothetical protein KUTeg_005116 [Tegillarca granosa]|uniref:Solute carrier family 23 member 2 n=1 Tax=Tegillarca granosa TaxID=220873 RepID=A0ABQ9FIU6_TEGGR|nr:hypothetical protein KUTeg_005116 [Tegillarca granosa]